MKAVAILAAVALLTLALPVASAGHTIQGCMSAWYPAPPPGWSSVCSTLDWAAHNPVSPLANCILSKVKLNPLTIDYIGMLGCI